MGEGRGDDRDAVPSPASFGRASRASLEESVKGRAEEDPPFVARLAEHFGEDPRGSPIVSERLSKIAHPNVQAAFEAPTRASDDPRSSRASPPSRSYAGLSPSDLVAPAGGACHQRLLVRYGASPDT